MKYQKRHQLLEIISEYKSDKSALTKQIDDLKRQLNEAESRIKRLLIRLDPTYPAPPVTNIFIS